MNSGLSSGAAQLDLHWAELMAAAQVGDRVSYERLLRDCTPLIRRVARHQGIQADRIDDVVQDVLLTVHRARQTYDPARSFTAWLCTIAQRRAIDALRRRGRQDRREVFSPIDYENHADGEADDFRDAGLESQTSAMKEAVEQLPPGQREAIEALALRQLSLDEAAGVTGKTKGALKVNMHRALKSLRARFGGSE
jgi:RNA polymerase sigma-70 factor (ECF subfamily)